MEMILGIVVGIGIVAVVVAFFVRIVRDIAGI